VITSSGVKITGNGQLIAMIPSASNGTEKKSPIADVTSPSLKLNARSALDYLTWLCRLTIPSVDAWRSWCWMFRLQLVADRGRNDCYETRNQLRNSFCEVHRPCQWLVSSYVVALSPSPYSHSSILSCTNKPIFNFKI